MVALVSWFVVGVIGLLTVVGILGVLVTSVQLMVRSLTARRAAASEPASKLTLAA